MLRNKRLVTVIFLALFLVAGLSASHRRTALRSPVCRFMHFYEAAQTSDMTTWERILYSLAVATRSTDS